MKKAASIFFSAILLFNLTGYQLVSKYLQHRSDVKLQVKLDDQLYNDDELVTFKLPLSIPYNNNSKDFESVEGEVKVKGVIYKYVKRRIYQDTLEVLCIVNKDKMRLQTAKDEFFQLCYDLKHSSSTKKNSQAPAAKILQLEYCEFINISILPLLTLQQVKHFRSFTDKLSSAWLALDIKPPEVRYC